MGEMAGFGRGKTLTVLSIDGGGIRGIIPATQLAFLESQLQVPIPNYSAPILYNFLINPNYKYFRNYYLWFDEMIIL